MINYSHNLTIATVLHWHKELFGQTKKDQAGKLRTYDVEISGSNYQPTHAIELAFLLREFFEWYHQNKNNLRPVHLAALIHLKFVKSIPSEMETEEYRGFL